MSEAMLGALTIEGLGKIYDAGRERVSALEGCDLGIGAGNFLASSALPAAAKARFSIYWPASISPQAAP